MSSNSAATSSSSDAPASMPTERAVNTRATVASHADDDTDLGWAISRLQACQEGIDADDEVSALDLSQIVVRLNASWRQEVGHTEPYYEVSVVYNDVEYAADTEGDFWSALDFIKDTISEQRQEAR